VRIVVDLNVLVSGIISKNGLPGQLLALWRERRYQLIASTTMIERLEEVLARPQLQSFVKEHEAAALIKDLKDAAILVNPQVPLDLTTDPEDNIVLATAVACRADMLVSGDQQHLLRLGKVQGIPIVRPRDAIERLTADT
jgi:putative PIN family toxin of toxin-antitoxin system